jgi:hypothetical protein
MGWNVYGGKYTEAVMLIFYGAVTAFAVIGLTGCSYWPAVRESYGQRVRILDGAVAQPARLVVVRAKVMSLRYPHHAWIILSPPDTDGDSEISTPSGPNCTGPVNTEPDADDGPSISEHIFVTAMAYLKILHGTVPHHAGVRYVDLDFGNDQIMEYYLTVGRTVTLRFTPGGRLYDIPHAPP